MGHARIGNSGSPSDDSVRRYLSSAANRAPAATARRSQRLFSSSSAWPLTLTQLTSCTVVSSSSSSQSTRLSTGRRFEVRQPFSSDYRRCPRHESNVCTRFQETAALSTELPGGGHNWVRIDLRQACDSLRLKKAAVRDVIPVMRQITMSGPEASLEEIEGVYRARAVQFERVAAAIVRDREAARDVVQDAFATVVRKRGGFARRGSVDAWIWRAVVNTALNRLRTDRRQAEGQRILIDDQRLDTSQDAGVLAELAQLPERQRLVVFLRYYADLDYSAIGLALGISSGTVASTLNSAHSALRRLLEEEGQP